MIQAPGDPNVTASLEVLFSPRCCSTCTLTTYQLLEAESSYMQMTYVSLLLLGPNISANYSAVYPMI